jgi:uncharacterized protein YcbK (DUF882 family)
MLVRPAILGPVLRKLGAGVFVLALIFGAAPAFAGLRGGNAPKKGLRTAPLPKPSGFLWIFAENTREEVKVNIYNPDGSFNQDALAQLDKLFRDYRRKEVKAIDPRLFEVLSIISDHFGQKRILFGSGFRVERDTSRHFHGSAADFRIEGVNYQQVFDFAKTLDPGGMGIGRYTTTLFVHVDFRAPGEPSFYWTDDSGSKKKGSSKKKKSDTPAAPKPKRSDKPNT